MRDKILTTLIILLLSASTIYAEIPENLLDKYSNTETVTLEYPINNEVVVTECNTHITDFFRITHTYPNGKGLFYLNIFDPNDKQFWNQLGDGTRLNTTFTTEGIYSWNIQHLYLKDYSSQLLEYGETYPLESEKQYFQVKCQQENIEDEVQEDSEIDKQIEQQPEPKSIIQSTVKGIKQQIKKIKDIFTWNIDIEKVVMASINKLEITTEITNKPEENNNTEVIKPFIFPFTKLIGVTQWHGNTAFQQPHTGIDFGATKETIISPGDGTVIAKGYDTFNGECFSGGNYLIIKHTNDMYTSYMHLEQTLVNINDEIDKGQEIAISGNSGQWNCQNLKYHLHFETRKGRSQTTHVNPVDYIETDWDQIITLNSENIPARLSGDNPHPTY